MHTLSAIELSARFREGKLSAVEIVDHFLDRIDRLDQDVGAFLEVYHEQARAQARALDEKRARGERLGKLAAVPIGIKDNINIQGEKTTCASRFLENFVSPYDATVIQLLKDEDAIFIGKTNLDEFAMGSSTEHSALGSTKNPWNLDCVPGGSSGGSAAAVAARLCPIALGSDTGGSIRQPAALCGIVGFKPTYGRVSRFGLVAFGSSLDQVGPFAQNTADAALVTEVLGRHCNSDSTSLPDPKTSYSQAVDTSIAGKRIGVPFRLIEELAAEPKAAFEQAIEVLKEQGASVVDIDLDIVKHSIAVYYIVANAEASTNLARFDGIRYGVRSAEAKTLDEVYDFSKRDGFGEEVKRRIMLGTFVLSAGYQDAYYKKAQRVRTLFIRKYQEAFTQCDVIAMPTSPFTAWERGSVNDPLQLYLADLYTISANLAGVPAINVPCGFDSKGLPFGLQLAGPQQCDEVCFQVAHAYERATSYNTAIPANFK